VASLKSKHEIISRPRSPARTAGPSLIAVKDAGIRVAAASSSKNAKLFLGVGVTRPDHHLLYFQRSIERLTEGIIGDTSAPG
jgi:hypothetical protein